MRFLALFTAAILFQATHPAYAEPVPEIPAEIDQAPAGDPDHPAFDEPILSDGSPFPCPKNDRDCACGESEEHPASRGSLALLPAGGQSLTARIDSLRKAKRSVRVEQYIFTADESGHAIADLLVQKKREGLRVQLLIDGTANLSLRDKELYVDLMDAGIEVVGAERGYPGLLDWFYDSPLPHFNWIGMRFHEKLWVIDAEDPENASAIVGGMNISNQYFRIGKDRYDDFDVMMKGDVVRDVAAAFDGDFAYRRNLKEKFPEIVRKPISGLGRVGDFFDRRAWHLDRFAPDAENQAEIDALDPAQGSPIMPDFKPARMRFIENRPRLHERFTRGAYVRMIRDTVNADVKEILIANAYLIIPGKADDPNNVKGALLDAVRKGVKVTILTNSSKSSDEPPVVYDARYGYKKLLEVNHDPETIANGGSLELYEWNGIVGGDPQGVNPESLLHDKIAVFGRTRAIVGSFNLDPRSDHLNAEDMLLFESPELASTMANRILNAKLPKSTRITMKQAKRFRKFKNIAERVTGWFEIRVLRKYF